MKRSLLLLWGVLLHTASLWADKITIHNKSKMDAYCGIYRLRAKEAELASSVQLLKGLSSMQIERPERKWGTDRELVCYTTFDKFEPKLSKQVLQESGTINVGSFQGSVFHVNFENGLWRGYTDSIWTTQCARSWSARQAADVLVGGDFHPGIRLQPEEFRSKQTTVRVGNELSEGERKALNERKKRVHKALKRTYAQHTGHSWRGFDPDITVNAVFSGGGYRAMIMTYGWLVGLQEEELLDTITWAAGLSGSTWALASWYDRGTTRVDDARRQVFNNIEGRGLLPPSIGEIQSLIIEAAALPYALGETFNVVDLYGAALARNLLSSKYTYLTDHIKEASSGLFPLPVYTAVMPRNNCYEWFEWTPWEVGGAWLGHYVQTGGYGRTYNKGVSLKNGPQKTLGFNLGTYGSAYGISMSEIVDRGYLEKAPLGPLKNSIKSALTIKPNTRISASIPNFTYNMAGSPIAQEEYLGLVDAGLAFNVPYPPVSGERSDRVPDVLLFFNASAGIDPAKELCLAWRYAQEHNLPFPTRSEDESCDLERLWDVIQRIQEAKKRGRDPDKQDMAALECLQKRAVTIFDDQIPGVPIVMYFSRSNDQSLWPKLDEASPEEGSPCLGKYDQYVRFCNGCDPRIGFDIDACTSKGACNTFNFKYSHDDLYNLTHLTEFQVRATAPEIRKVIVRAMERKHGAQYREQKQRRNQNQRRNNRMEQQNNRQLNGLSRIRERQRRQ